jgi:DNA-binding CsgD family transcriptional regulator
MMRGGGILVFNTENTLDNRTNILYNERMTLWQQLRHSVKDSPTAGAYDTVSKDLAGEVMALAERERREPDEVILSLLRQALKERRVAARTRKSWDSLSPREKQVAALICRGLTSRQTAARLFISPETVKTHVRHILRKFRLNSRIDLRKHLHGWDLSAWADEALH